MTWIYGNIKSYHFTHSPKEFIMSQVAKEIDYQAFYNFALQKNEKEPTITMAEVFKQFQAHNDAHVSEYDLAMYEIEKNGHGDERIQADAQRATLGTSF